MFYDILLNVYVISAFILLIMITICKTILTVDTVSNRNKYQECFLAVKAAGA
jgi:hypothetical protein